MTLSLGRTTPEMRSPGRNASVQDSSGGGYWDHLACRTDTIGYEQAVAVLETQVALGDSWGVFPLVKSI